MRCNILTRTGNPCKNSCERGLNRCRVHRDLPQKAIISIPPDSIRKDTPRPQRKVKMEIRSENFAFSSEGEEVTFICKKDLFLRIIKLAREEKEISSLLETL